jgi:two-component system response regulator RegA
MTVRVLIVDDDDRFRERLGKAIAARGYEVRAAASRTAALAVAAAERLDRAVVDLRMPGGSGLALLRDLLALQPQVAVVVLTGYGSIATTVEAMRLGARDYLTKPCHADRILGAFDGDSEQASREPEDSLAFEIPSLARLEWEHIERVLHECHGNVSKTARILGMHRRTLQHKLAKFPVSR